MPRTPLETLSSPEDVARAEPDVLDKYQVTGMSSSYTSELEYLPDAWYGKVPCYMIQQPNGEYLLVLAYDELRLHPDDCEDDDRGRVIAIGYGDFVRIPVYVWTSGENRVLVADGKCARLPQQAE